MVKEIEKNNSRYRVKNLINEVKSSNIKKDTLSDSAFAFEGQAEAMYFSNARRYVASNIAHKIMDRI